MYEVKQAQVARAIDVLRGGPLTAAQFAVKMWPDRATGKSPGKQSMIGHGLLRRLGELNYVEKIGDLWMLRRLDSASLATFGSANGHTNGYGGATGLPTVPPLGLSTELASSHPSGQLNGQVNGQAEQLRLAWLVQQATEPVRTITSDAALGNIAIRGQRVGGALVEACAFVVLSGRNLNVYPPCMPARMLVGLQPAEGAHALLLRWRQSGRPPELPRPGAWITIEDGVVATPGFWRPAGAPGNWADREDIRDRIARLRRGAGLA